VGYAGGAGHVAGALFAPQGVATTSGRSGSNGPVIASIESFVESEEYRTPYDWVGQAVSSTDWLSGPGHKFLGESSTQADGSLR